MEWLLLFAFAVVFAILLNWGLPQAESTFPNVAGSFWGVTAITAVFLLVLLVVVSWVFAEVAGKRVA
jgi:nitrogen fixation/metabolism regulation signal transduction histidine kinase